MASGWDLGLTTISWTVSRIGSTDINGESPRGSGNPAEYEQQLIEVLQAIINRPGSRLVE